MKDYDYLKRELTDLMYDVSLDAEKQYEAKNQDLGAPLSAGQMRLVVEIACAVAANMVYGFNDILDWYEECRQTALVSDEGPADAPDATDGALPDRSGRATVIPFPALGSQPKRP